MKLVELAHFTHNVASMTSFYARLLGADPVAKSDDMAIFRIDDGEAGARLFIHRSYTPGEGELPPVNHTAFAVADVEATCRELVGQGLALEVPPRDYYWGRSAYLRDPDGNQIELIQRSPTDGPDVP